MFVPTPPYGYKNLVYQWKTSKQPFLKKNSLYTCKATAINKEGIVISYFFRSKKWRESRQCTLYTYPRVTLFPKKSLLDLKNKWHLNFIMPKQLNKAESYRRCIIFVHRAVYFTFNPKFKDLKYYDMSGMVIHHKDGVKNNPNYDNLDEVTYSENRSNIFYKKGERLNYVQQRIIPKYNPNINQLRLDI